MSNTKQTAVEYLVREVRQIYTTTCKMPDLYDKIRLAIEQAKQMEKEQIKTAWCEGNESEPKEITMDFAEQHYTQTYHAFKGELIQDEIGNLKPKNYGK